MNQLEKAELLEQMARTMIKLEERTLERDRAVEALEGIVRGDPSPVIRAELALRAIKPHKGVKWTLFTDTFVDGYIPTSVVSEEGKPDSWDYYDTEREAQIECLEELEEQARQVKDGEREADESDLCGNEPEAVLKWIEAFTSGHMTWAQLLDLIEPNMKPEEVEPTDDGGFIFNGKQFPCPEEADFR